MTADAKNLYGFPLGYGLNRFKRCLLLPVKKWKPLWHGDKKTLAIEPVGITGSTTLHDQSRCALQAKVRRT